MLSRRLSLLKHPINFFAVSSSQPHLFVSNLIHPFFSALRDSSCIPAYETKAQGFFRGKLTGDKLVGRSSFNSAASCFNASSQNENWVQARSYRQDLLQNDFSTKRSRVEAVENVISILHRIPEPPVNYQGSELIRIVVYLDAKLQPYRGFMDAYEVSHVLRGLKDPLIAIGFFKWAKKQPNYSPDIFIYTTLIKICGRSKLYKEMEYLLEEMIRCDCKPDVVTFTEVIKCYSFNNDTRKAMLTFQAMKDFGIHPNEFTYSVVVDMLAKAGLYVEAFKIYKEMEKLNVFRDSVLCTSMINLCAKMGRVAEAESIFNSMRVPGCFPDVRTYSVMVDMYQKSGMLKKAIRMYNQMTTSGIRPTLVTLNVLLKAYLNRNLDKEYFVKKVKKEIAARGMKLDVVWYNTMIDDSVKKGNFKEAHKLCKEMMKNEIEFDSVTYRTLMHWYLREGKYSSAQHILTLMSEKGLLPSLPVYISCFFAWNECKGKEEKDEEEEEEEGKEKIWRLMEAIHHPIHDLVLMLTRDGFCLDDHAMEQIQRHLDSLEDEEMDDRDGLVDVVMCYLTSHASEFITGRIWNAAKSKGCFRNSILEEGSHWSINLHGMSSPTAIVALRSALLELRDRALEGEKLKSNIAVITGWGRRSPVHGKSAIKRDVYALLERLHDHPFMDEISKGGALLADGRSVERWLLNPKVASELRFQ